MKRKEFLSMLGIGAAAVACTACFSGCAKQDNGVSPPANVDFTIDITDPTKSDLNGTGYNNDGVIVVKTTGGAYAAVSAACTHQGTTVYYRRSSNDFYCNSHGSSFAIDGNVTHSPATSSLKHYNTTLTGNLLRVYS